MVRPTGKRAAAIAGALSALVALGLGIALRETLREWWLLRRLESTEPSEAIIRELGAMGSVRAVPRLLEVAGATSWSELSSVAEAALEGLIAKAGPRALPALLKGLDHPQPTVRALALKVLGRSSIERRLTAD